MNPLFDMIANMQNANQSNSISEQMAKQFGLQQDQAAKAMEALMPAFSQGLKRNAAASPAGMASFMEALAKGNHANYMNNPMEAFSPKGMSEGNAILGHLFGNKEVSRAVAAQAEAASGVSQSILKQMLPALAPMVMGGLFKQMTGQSEPTPQMQNAFGGGGGILGQILEQVMKGGLGGATGGGQQTPNSQPRAKNPLESILEQMTGGGTATGGQSSNNPGGSLGDIFNDMLKNSPMGQAGTPETSQSDTNPYDEPLNDLNDVFGRKKRAQEEDPYSEEVKSERQGYPQGTGLEDLFGDLFKPSKQGAPQYDKAIESIFDQFMKPKG